MKKFFTILSAMLLATGAFAATEQAWYNDVTSIAANGQYYIYSVNGKGFMQAGQDKIKSITTSNYNTINNVLFTISKADAGKTYCGSSYVSSYQYGTCGPVGTSSTDGSDIVWTAMSSNSYWNIHGKYSFIGTKYAALYYDGSYAAAANVLGNKETQTGAKYQWYLISPAQYNRHFAIYFFDAYKEECNIAQYENQVPAAYYTALQTAYNKSFSVKNADHSEDVVNEAKAELEALYTGAPAVKEAYVAAKGTIDALEAVEDKGEDFAQITTDIANARTALAAAMNVEAIEASVANLKTVDPIAFSQTTFEVFALVNNAASSVAGRTIAYDAANKAIINAEGKAIYAGTTTLTATAATTDQYYKFVRSAQVTVTAPTTYGEFSATTCGEAVEFNEQTYEESYASEVHLTNIYGGDSVVTVAITINHPTFGTDEKTIVYGADESWNGISLKDSTVGVHTVIFVTTNVAGCDSTVTLTLTVNKMETLNVPVDLQFCAGGSDFFRGVEYSEAGTYPVNATGATCDTVYNVTVTVLQPTTGTDTKTIVYGAEEEWNGISLKDSTVGVHYVVYETTNVAGCDSTVTLTLTVNKQATVEMTYPIEFCAEDQQEYRGVVYTEAGSYPLDLIEGAISDTMITVVVTVHEKMLTNEYVEDSVGHVIELPDGLWYLGEELLEASTYELQLADTAGLEFIHYDETEFGCDSTVKIIVTVLFEAEPENPGETTALERVNANSEAVKEFRNGVLYIRRGERLFTAEGREVK